MPWKFGNENFISIVQEKILIHNCMAMSWSYVYPATQTPIKHLSEGLTVKLQEGISWRLESV
jgi:hypothetical protein